ncbi:ATP-binding protein [Paenibacillus chartarius]|uniref:histidine kinase n=1 Tax=Paenibacillus chartarius TaxID=747481 RepID=A0ABV6DSE2_9BACL
MSRSRASLLYVTAIIVLLVMISASSFLASLSMNKQSAAIVSEAIPYSDAANRLLTDLVNQETGIRGYLISADSKFLEPFHVGRAQLEQDLSVIHRFDTKFPEVHALIEAEILPQIQRIQAYHDSQISLVQAGQLEEARSRAANGKQNMDQFRAMHNRVLGQIGVITNDAYQASMRAGKWSRYITVLGSLFAFIIAVLSTILTVRTNRAEDALRKSEETYRIMAESLEAQNEEISVQQEEQERTLVKLSQRELELETIATYQEKLTGQLRLQDFLNVSVPSLLDSLHADAALVIVRRSEAADSFEVVYSSGYPSSHTARIVEELFGPAKRAFDEKKPITHQRSVSKGESGLHEGISSAIDQYYPLLDDKGEVYGALLLTFYNMHDTPESKLMLTRGLTKQFGLAFYAQLVNEERRKQAARLALLNDQLLAEKQMIEEHRDLIGRILTAAHDGMMLCGADGRIQFANQQMRHYFSREALEGHSLVACCMELEQTIPGYGPVREAAQALLGGGQRSLTERFTLRPGEPQEQHIEMYAVPVGDNVGAADNGYLIVFRDRTEEERIDEMKNEFVSIVSHELRTPLASVLGFVEILLNRDLPSDKQKKYMETIYREATRLSTLINDFLDLQRMESGKQVYHITPVEATAVVREVIEQWQGKSGHRIHLHASAAELWLKADADRLRQVLHNLVSNAIKYSPDADRVDIRLSESAGRAVIEVQDYGLGIPPEAKISLFTKFYRVDNTDRRQIGGTGLGLAIVKEIMEAHQGGISFESNMREGTTFRLEFELFASQPLEHRIVILEDDDNLAKLMQVALSQLNLPTVQLRSAEEGILLLERAGSGPPLLFIVDIYLDDAKTGWEFMSYVYASEAYNRIPIIVSTAMDQPSTYREKEIERYLKKPFTMERLLQVVISLLEAGGKPVYVFPAQDQNAVTSSLQRNGIKVQDIKVDKDMLVVDVAPKDDGRK